MLSSQLQQLVEDGIVRKKTFAEVPPRVEYSLTSAGRSLIPVIAVMERWGIEHQKKDPATPDCLWNAF